MQILFKYYYMTNTNKAVKIVNFASNCIIIIIIIVYKCKFRKKLFKKKYCMNKALFHYLPIYQ